MYKCCLYAQNAQRLILPNALFWTKSLLLHQTHTCKCKCKCKQMHNQPKQTYIQVTALMRRVRATRLSLKAELEVFGDPDKLTREQLVPPTLDEYRPHIARHNPQIIHFAGHGHKDGKLLIPEHWADSGQFAEACCISDRLHTVFINTCFGQR